jgi:transcriptional regulator with XRE-family HTH domain
MKKFQELIETPEYWLETIQNELYQHVYNYMEREKINQTQLAQRLGVTKGYISQVLNGQFNHRLEKLIELSLEIGIAPDMEFKTMQQYLKEQQIIRSAYVTVNVQNPIEDQKTNFIVVRNIESSTTVSAIPA